MARRKSSRTFALRTKSVSTDAEAGPPHPIDRRRKLLVAIGLTLALGVAAITYFRLMPPAPSLTAALSGAKPEGTRPPQRADYVGASVCRQCHEREFEAWTGSHHQLAMQEANASTMLGNFDNARFRYYGVESHFFKRDGRYLVRTDGPDGKLHDYAVKYTFGVTPLQQYLIEFPGGRYQVLGIAWDTRPKNAGGQRWFHLYPHERIDHRDQLHWTGLYQNWNLQCAECHSTNLRKGYDAAVNSYKTTFSEINVSCEACHGPGSRHVQWAQQSKAPYPEDDAKGLAVRLQSRWNQAWRLPSDGAKFAERDRPAPDAVMNVCWSCHARRGTIAEGGIAGAALEETHRPAVVTPPSYHADGQQRDEVYTWGSFRQSRMFQRGVTCMDCHEPHGLKLRAHGNALCARCHNGAVFDTAKHHFHKIGTQGAQCIDCHAPRQNYMVIDGRHDHSFRVPRPDLSLAVGSPNACTQCHRDRKPEWAVAAMNKWYGETWRDRPHYGPTLHAGAKEGVKAVPALLELARDPSTPAIVRASAATLAQPHVRPTHLPAVRSLLQDADPSVRVAALGLLEPFDPAVRAQAAAPLLADPIRGVRIEAARVLAEVPEGQLVPDQRGAREVALKEYVEALRRDADWPAANVNLGNLRLRQGRPEEAIAAYEHALALDPRFVGAYVNLADASRRQGREGDGERVLRRGLSVLPRTADLHHVLGLLLVRKGDQAAALRELATAVKLAPENTRFAYVYAVGLHSTGKRGEALTVLRAAATRQPYDLDVLSALVSMNREAGNSKAALAYARRLADVMPDDAGVRRLVADLEGTK